MNTSPDEKIFKPVDEHAVKVLLAMRNWNVSDLARRVGKKPQVVHNVLKGRRPQSKLIPEIAVALITKEEGPAIPDESAHAA